MLSTALSSVLIFSLVSLSNLSPASAPQKQVLSEKSISLDARQPDPWVNSIFKDNILLNMAYLKGTVSSSNNLDWDEVRKPFKYEFRLEPGQTFAYHEDILDKYQGKVVKTTNAHFNSTDGFKSDGYLMGDGVCHLASLIYWAAKDAGLESYAPSNHDFASINEISREYGVAIFYMPGSKSVGERQNLYITNNFDKPVIFEFEFDGSNLKTKILKDN